MATFLLLAKCLVGMELVEFLVGVGLDMRFCWGISQKIILGLELEGIPRGLNRMLKTFVGARKTFPWGIQRVLKKSFVAWKHSLGG